MKLQILETVHRGFLSQIKSPSVRAPDGTITVDITTPGKYQFSVWDYSNQKGKAFSAVIQRVEIDG